MSERDTYPVAANAWTSARRGANRPSAPQRLGKGPVFWTTLTIVNICAFGIAWELFARTGTVSRLFLPRPTAMWEALQGAVSEGDLWGHMAFSGRNFAIGVGLAAIVGIPVGLMAGTSRAFYRILSPYIWSMASLPRVAWLPLLILIFGFSNASKLTLIFVAAVFPMVINCLAGVRTVDPSLVTAGKVFGARWHHRYLHIVIPHAAPYIFSGFKQGIARSLAAVVVSEMFGGSQGLGFLIVLAGQRFNSALLYALLLVIVVAAVILVRGVDWLERRLAPWRREVSI